MKHEARIWFQHVVTSISYYRRHNERRHVYRQRFEDDRGLGRGETVSLVKLVNEFVRFRLNRISSVGDRLVRLSDLFNGMMTTSVCKDGQKTGRCKMVKLTVATNQRK